MKEQPPVPVSALLEAPDLQSLDFHVLVGSDFLDRSMITNPRIQKPGLALAGYFPYIKPGRLQILGQSEFDYLATLPPHEALSRFKLLIQRGLPALVAAKGLRPPKDVLSFCESRGVPFLLTHKPTSHVISAISLYLEDRLAPQLQLHGVLVEVYSLGTLIVGDAGIGKSECALELVYRGHRLVADDIVILKRTHGNGLVGMPHPELENFLELRGVGIIDVRKHFGMTATTPSVGISLMIRLMKLNDEVREMERSWREALMTNGGAWAQTKELLGKVIPLYTMAVVPGRDLAIMVETAVRKCLLAQRGVDDERVFLDSVNRRAQNGVTGEPPNDEE
ncbi:MAG: HPr(Ser) kinase/phosphatase [Acidobacteria bacterium]|nr:HPr(Ser) kinase/phosphatase [Acidobacteriota bacterium]